MHDQAIILRTFLDLDALTLDEIAVATSTNPGPGHAEVSEFADRDRGLLGKYLRNLLVGAPVGAAHGVEKVDRRIVTLGLDAVAERRLHAALGGTAVAAPRGYQGKYQYVMTGDGRLDSAALAREPAANHQHIGGNQLSTHDAAPARRNASGGSMTPASTSSTTIPRPRKNQSSRRSTVCNTLRESSAPAPHLVASR